jgi:fructosamine-3-kinase
MTDALGAAIAEAIGEATRRPFRATEVSPVGGGCIHQAVRLSGNHGGSAGSFFAKANERARADLFAAEADGLAALAQTRAVRVPAVVARGESGDHAFLVLEWLELGALDAASGARLGTQLAAMHRETRDRFGWARDNYIGATPQENTPGDDWHAFFRDRRLHPQLRLAARNRLPSRLIDRGERLLADCEAFFRGHRPAASLLHGDLWGGNAAALGDGTPVLFDPAVYAGDRETDLAMAALFGGFPPDFASAYQDAWPLPDGHRTRRGLYNLYHVLNHANLFAGGYVRQAEESIGRLLSEVA